MLQILNNISQDLFDKDYSELTTAHEIKIVLSTLFNK
jgi:hypothetical protein